MLVVQGKWSPRYIKPYEVIEKSNHLAQQLGPAYRT